jgi:hypothetical protein
MFAGSVRMMELMQARFEAEGAAFTIAAGLSWGGITSVIYEGYTQRTRAIVPMFASPNLAQVLWDAAELLQHPVLIDREQLFAYLDFTPYLHHCEDARIFAVMGEDDLFFRFENHAAAYGEGCMITLPSAHVGGMWRMTGRLRQRVLEALDWSALNPRPMAQTFS